MTAPRSPLARLRALCLALPDTTEVEAWGEPTFRTRGRLFAMFASASTHHGAGRPAVWLNAAAENQALLVGAEPGRYFVPPYVGPRGWIGAWLDAGCDWTAVADLVRDAHGRVAAARPGRRRQTAARAVARGAVARGAAAPGAAARAAEPAAANGVTLRIVVEGPLPGVRLAVQRGRDVLVPPVAESAAEAVFEWEARVAETAAGPVLRGAELQGPPAGRFVYVNAGTSAGQAGSPWTRRAKVPLAGLTPELLAAARGRPGAALEARIAGAARDGGPACATVPLLGGWRVAAAPTAPVR